MAKQYNCTQACCLPDKVVKYSSFAEDATPIQCDSLCWFTYSKVELAVQMVTNDLIQAQSEIRPLHKGS